MPDKPLPNSSGSSSSQPRPAEIVPIERARTRRAAAVNKADPPPEIIECPVDVGFYETDIGVVSVDGEIFITTPGCLLVGDKMALLPTITQEQALVVIERLSKALRVLGCAHCAATVIAAEPTLPVCDHVAVNAVRR